MNAHQRRVARRARPRPNRVLIGSIKLTIGGVEYPLAPVEDAPIRELLDAYGRHAFVDSPAPTHFEGIAPRRAYGVDGSVASFP